MGGVVKLLTNVGADSGIDIIGDFQTWHGGPGDFWVWGDLGGGQIDLHAALDENAPAIASGTTITETTPISAGVAKFNLSHGTKIRAVVTSTSATSSGMFAKVN